MTRRALSVIEDVIALRDRLSDRRDRDILADACEVMSLAASASDGALGRHEGIVRDEPGPSVRAEAPTPLQGGVNGALLEVAKALLASYDRNTCQHDSTHRGGIIWTICDDCGRKWADDEGGFRPYVEPAYVTEARTAIAAAEAGGKGEEVRGERDFYFRTLDEIANKSAMSDKEAIVRHARDAISLAKAQASEAGR